MKVISLQTFFLAGMLMLLTPLLGCSNDVALIEQKCVSCHSFQGSYAEPRSAAEWQRVVTSMKGMGLKLTDSEESQIVKALSKEYGR
jgi:hypothetical protein